MTFYDFPRFSLQISLQTKSGNQVDVGLLLTVEAKHLDVILNASGCRQTEIF
jgi:hypothetical protein